MDDDKNRKLLLDAYTYAVSNLSLKNYWEEDQACFKRVLNKTFEKISQDVNSNLTVDSSSFQVSYNKGTSVTKTTIGRYIRRQMKINSSLLSDEVLNSFSQEFIRYLVSTQEVSLNKRIKYLSGSKITSHYSNAITNSCMTGEDSTYVELYGLNPDKVSLVVLDSFARALLWTCDDGTKVLDRIYPSGSKEVAILTQWAIDKGYVRRLNPDRAGYEEDEQLSDFSVRSITLKYADYFPYMDTFKFAKKISDDEVIISNLKSYFDSRNDFCEAIHTDGKLPWDAVPHCECCEERIRRGDDYERHGMTYCSQCFNERFTMCSECDDYEDNDDINYVEGENIYVCNHCLNRGFTTCEGCNESIRNRKIIQTGDGDFVCESCLEGNYSTCESCEDYYHIDNLTTADNNLYCEDCLTSHCKKCSYCDKFHENKNIQTIINEKSYCDDCVDNEFVKCDSCGDFEGAASAVSDKGKDLCEQCFLLLKMETDDKS